MKQGTILIQDRKREGKVKTAEMAALIAGLAVATLVLDSQIAILAVLVVWAVACMLVTRKADKEHWYHAQLPWTVDDTTAVIGDKTISRKDIKRTMCTPRPGFQRKMFRGWQLKVETQKDVYLWYSYYEDTDNTASVQSLQKLAEELGCEWKTWTHA